MLRCNGREQAGLNTTNTVKYLRVRDEAEYVELMKALSDQKWPIKLNAPLITLEK